MGQDGAKRSDTPQHGACGGCGTALHAAKGGLGVLHQKMFVQIYEEGPFRATLCMDNEYRVKEKI